MARTSETFFAVWQAADYAGLKIEAVYELLESGEIAGEQADGRWRVRKSAMDAWLDADVSREELEKLTPHLRGVAEAQARDLLNKLPPE